MGRKDAVSRISSCISTEPEQITAILHDVVEDTDVSLAQLAAEGFSHVVLAAVEALTKRPGETRMAAARRAVKNPVARIVKLADNAENMDLSRIEHPSEQDCARLKEYEAVRALLLQHST